MTPYCTTLELRLGKISLRTCRAAFVTLKGEQYSLAYISSPIAFNQHFECVMQDLAQRSEAYGKPVPGGTNVVLYVPFCESIFLDVIY